MGRVDSEGKRQRRQHSGRSTQQEAGNHADNTHMGETNGGHPIHSDPQHSHSFSILEVWIAHRLQLPPWLSHILTAQGLMPIYGGTPSLCPTTASTQNPEDQRGKWHPENERIGFKANYLTVLPVSFLSAKWG